MDGITILAAYAIMLAGKFDDLESLGTLIVSTVLDVEVMLIRFSSGWRLLLICRDQTALNACYTLIRDRLQGGMVATILNGAAPMVTRIYETP